MEPETRSPSSQASIRSSSSSGADVPPPAAGGRRLAAREGGLLGLFRLTLLTHEGEELVGILPAIMLLGAWILLRWAGAGERRDESEPPVPPPNAAPPAAPVPTPGPDVEPGVGAG